MNIMIKSAAVAAMVPAAASSIAATPVTKPAAMKPTTQTSVVRELVAAYRRKNAEGDRWSKKESEAIKRAEAMLAPLDPRISLDELKSHPDFDIVDERSRTISWGRGQIPSHVIVYAIESQNECLPLTDEKQELIGRLRERLQLATDREAQHDRAYKVHRVVELEKRVSKCCSEAYEIEKKIIRTQSQDRADVIAKWKLYKSSPKYFDELSIARSTLLTSIAKDAIALMERNEVVL